MYCPRCGAPNTDTTKFCRQCGLPMAQLTGYVASGGAVPPAPPPVAPTPLEQLTAGMTPWQKMVLAILCFVFLPPIFSALGLRPLAGVAGILMVPGILWTVFHFKAQGRRLRQQQMMQPPTPIPPLTQPPPEQPVLPAQTYQPPIYQSSAAPPTNPLRQERGSVTEEETRQLPGQS